jgi:cyclophilin family peptidyl-prolyl cis-trans isomerase/predicted Ser/Thr protein kinase
MEETPGMEGTPGPDSAEERIGPYRIVRELGRGGMGTVYLCEDTNVGNRLVALKVVHDPFGAGADLIERFKREIRNLGVLRHPNLVQVLYAGERAGHPYFVMEYVRGRELNKWLDEIAALPEPQRIAAIVRLMAKVARGVAHAHQNGTIHRDLKPQNILVREDGEPMVLDFGIAKHREDSTLTATAATPGTPSHMAPEQFEPAKIVKEELVDVWALGTILYLALTRERPFKGQSLASVSYQIVHGTPTNLRKLNEHVPPVLEDLVLRCLEKDPRKRTQSAQAVGERLEGALHDVLHSARRRTLRASALVALAVVVVALLAVRPWRFFERAEDFSGLRPVFDGVGLRAAAPGEREIVIASFQPEARFRLQESMGATFEAALVKDDGIELDRALLAPVGGGVHRAAFGVPPDRQRESLRARLRVFANGSPLEVDAPVLVMDTTPPRIAASIVSGGVERIWDPDLARADVEGGASLRLVVTDPTGPVVAAWDPGGPAQGDPLARPVPLDAEGVWRATLRVRDAAGNEAVRSFEAQVGLPASRAESSATSRAGPSDVQLPEVWGRITRVGSLTKFDAPAPLKTGENLVTVDNALAALDFRWRLRLVDAVGSTVAECDLKPESPFGAATKRTLSGKLEFGALEGRLLSAEFVILDGDGRPRAQPVASPRFIEGALKPRARLTLSRGEVQVELDRTLSPEAVEAFLDNTRAGVYDGGVIREIRKDQFLKAGPADDRKVPIPASWTRSRPTTAKMVVALTGASEFLVHLRDNPNLDLLDAVEIGKVVLGEDVLLLLAREAEAGSRPAVSITKVAIESE